VHRAAIRVMDLLKQRYFAPEVNLKDKVSVEGMTTQKEPAIAAGKGRNARGGVA
jgi:hypothetical protein